MKAQREFDIQNINWGCEAKEEHSPFLLAVVKNMGFVSKSGYKILSVPFPSYANLGKLRKLFKL